MPTTPIIIIVNNCLGLLVIAGSTVTALVLAEMVFAVSLISWRRRGR
jgi:hypothetical protein